MIKSLSKPILLFLLGCSLMACNFSAHANPPVTYEARPTIIWPSATPSPTVTQTGTPAPTLTATATPIASQTPVILPTLTPTTLPRSLQLRIFEDVWSVVNDYYLYPDFNGVDWAAVRAEFQGRVEVGLDNAGFYSAMYEMIARLGDEHSSYLSPEDVAHEEANYMGNYDYVGIGVLHQPIPERQRTVILSVFSASPAEAAGLKPRDAIYSADGVPILDEDGYYQDIIRGPAGTTTTLTVQTPGEATRQVTVTRQRITGAMTLPYQVLTGPGGLRVGYIFLFGFDDSTMDEQVGKALYNMTAEGRLDGLILDLRMNGGGVNSVVEPTLGYFTGGVVGNYVYREEQRPLVIYDNDINGSLEVPLVVLVGSGTASYGEIFAGVLQDSGRAKIIGTTTDGNVEVMWAYDFEDGSQLWLASETFRPYYHQQQDWEVTGIIPDVLVAGDFDENSLENDPPVLAAIAYFATLP